MGTDTWTPPQEGPAQQGTALVAALSSSWVGGLRPSSQGRELPLPARVRGTAEALPWLVILHLNWKVGQGLPARGLDRHGCRERRPRREASWALTHLCIYSPETLPRSPPGSRPVGVRAEEGQVCARACRALRPGLAAADGRQLLKVLRLPVAGFPLTGLRGRPPQRRQIRVGNSGHLDEADLAGGHRAAAPPLTRSRSGHTWPLGRAAWTPPAGPWAPCRHREWIAAPGLRAQLQKVGVPANAHSSPGDDWSLRVAGSV